MFRIEFETINSGIQTAEEISRILRHIGQKATNGETEGKIRDCNGNTIGEWSWSTRISDMTESENFRASLLAIHLANDYNFYSSLKAWFGECAIAMREGEYKESNAKSHLLGEVTKACLSPMIKRHVGPTSAREKAYCADVLLEKYEEEILSIKEDLDKEDRSIEDDQKDREIYNA